MEKQILEILAENGRMSAEEIAVMLGALKVRGFVFGVTMGEGSKK